MANENLLTIFIAVTAAAVLIQTGILAGLYFVSMKLSRQTERAMDASESLLGPLHRVVENLQGVTTSVAEISATTRAQIQQLERWWRRSA